MRSCLILGSGRSGTSMVTGLLAGCGYFMGRRLWPARDANPKGFFEDREVNLLNESLLRPITGWRLPGPLGRLHPARPGRLQRWLALVAPETPIRAGRRASARIVRLTAQRPFCFKDPRFCYTLPAWRPYLGDAAYVCVFREPQRTVASIARELATAPYLRGLRLAPAEIGAVWQAMYRQVLDRHRADGDWLFLHYDQVLSGERLAALDELLGVRADRSFAEPRLQRSAVDGGLALPAAVLGTYRELCELAGHRP